MPLASLVLFALVLAPPLNPSQPVQPVATGSASTFVSDNAAIPVQNFQLSPLPPSSDKAQMPSDDVCYKIRAYIFKRDDDHAPEFVRSTTCGPNKPQTKDTVWPKAKIVPAD